MPEARAHLGMATRPSTSTGSRNEALKLTGWLVLRANRFVEPTEITVSAANEIAWAAARLPFL